MTPAAAVAIALLAAAPIAAPDVVWTQKPTTDQLSQLPRLPTEFRGGKVLLDCRIQSDGRLDDCNVASEEPVDRGLGAWTLKAAALFRAAPLSKSGLPVAGRRITIPFRFDQPTDAPSQPPPAAPQ